MKIMFAASEMAPFAKTGGLADVVGALPIALSELGHDVICCLPFYRCVREVVSNPQPTGISFEIPLGSRLVRGDVLETRLAENVRVLLVRRDEYFDRSHLYGTGERDYDDNAERFLFFSKVVVELQSLARFRCDVVHCHDWQTAFVPVQAKYRRQTRGTEYGAPTVLTIHNLAYQGTFLGTDFPLTNLPGDLFSPQGLEFYGKLNLLKGGILYADALTTVSKTYASEIRTAQLGCGLDGVLQLRQARLTGIVNGADYRTWNPATDPLLAQNYNAGDLRGKQSCRAALAERFGFAMEDPAPIAAVITRLAEQKGVDILLSAVDDLRRVGVRLVVLGTGERAAEQRFVELARQHPRSIAVVIGHDEKLAHVIQGGADCLLMPSRFEPCGLTQLYALKYGTIPVVRATGGLEDTVVQFDPATGAGTGFKFAAYDALALVDAMQTAVQVFRKPSLWRRLVLNAMACDFSWQASAKEYEQLYAALVTAAQSN